MTPATQTTSPYPRTPAENARIVAEAKAAQDAAHEALLQKYKKQN